METCRRLVETARQSGDRLGEVVALIDLGVFVLNSGDFAIATEHLRKALELCRERGDRAREADALNNLGFALLAQGRTQDARETLESALAAARETNDAYLEKLVLERLGMAHANLRDPSGAMWFLSQALEAARAMDDRQQEARVLWLQAIALAEMNQPGQAAARAEESTAVLRASGKPEAAWYEALLARYRAGESALAGQPPTFAAGPIYAGPVATSQPDSTQAVGPSLLRMALTATKAMATFLGSGMKTAPADVQRTRLAVCRSCEHHTGLRCRVCGCFTKVKAQLDHEHCPIGRW